MQGPALDTGAFASWLWANRVDFFNSDQTEAAFNTQAGVETVEFLRKLVVASEYLTVQGGVPMNFERGATAIQFGNLWQIQRFARVLGLRNTYTATPRAPRALHGGGAAWIQTYGSAASTQRPDAAFAWTALFCGSEGQALNAELTYFPPARFDVFASPSWQKVLARVPSADRAPLVLAAATVRPTAHYDQIAAEMNGLLKAAIIDGTVGPKEALTQAELHANRMLADPTYATT